MSNQAFATVSDVSALFRALTTAETTRAEALLPLVSDMIRQYGTDAGVDVDEKAEDEESYASLLKIVTVDVVSRILRQSTTGEPVTQESQGALGYTWQGTYAVPGGGIAGAILYNDLKRLGLLAQTMEVVETWAASEE